MISQLHTANERKVPTGRQSVGRNNITMQEKKNYKNHCRTPRAEPFGAIRCRGFKKPKQDLTALKIEIVTLKRFHYLQWILFCESREAYTKLRVFHVNG